jgi:hypothetical protein
MLIARAARTDCSLRLLLPLVQLPVVRALPLCWLQILQLFIKGFVRVALQELSTLPACSRCSYQPCAAHQSVADPAAPQGLCAHCAALPELSKLHACSR